MKVNIVVIQGYVATAPSFKLFTDNTTDGKSEKYLSCLYRLGVPRTAAKGETRRKVDYFTIQATYNQAEYVKDHLKQGSEVTVEGKLKNVPTDDGNIETRIIAKQQYNGEG